MTELPNPPLAPAAQRTVAALLAEHVPAGASLVEAQSALLPVLHAIQEHWGYVPLGCLPLLAQRLGCSGAEVYGVLTFYPDFKTEPQPAHRLQICRAESCQACHSEALWAHAEAWLGQTQADVALEPVYCLGLCANSPALQLDGVLHAAVDAPQLDALLHALPRRERT